jgi:hypothetical protein
LKICLRKFLQNYQRIDTIRIIELLSTFIHGSCKKGGDLGCGYPLAGVHGVLQPAGFPPAALAPLHGKIPHVVNCREQKTYVPNPMNDRKRIWTIKRPTRADWWSAERMYRFDPHKIRGYKPLKQTS